MKNLSNRTKIISAIVAAVVIVVIAVVVFTQVGGGELSGASTLLVITPTRPTITVGATLGLSVNAVATCNWYTSNAAVVALQGSTTDVKHVTVNGIAAGQAIIEAHCGVLNVDHVSTLVTVVIPPPPTVTPTVTPTFTPTVRPTVTPTLEMPTRYLR